MMRASFEDMQLATAQGTILHIDFGDFVFGKSMEDVDIMNRKVERAELFFTFSSLAFAFAGIYFIVIVFRLGNIEYMDKTTLLDKTEDGRNKSGQRNSGRKGQKWKGQEKSFPRKSRVVSFEAEEDHVEQDSNPSSVWNFIDQLMLSDTEGRSQSPRRPPTSLEDEGRGKSRRREQSGPKRGRTPRGRQAKSSLLRSKSLASAAAFKAGVGRVEQDKNLLQKRRRSRSPRRRPLTSRVGDSQMGVSRTTFRPISRQQSPY
jgi:hypothetical protein